MISWLPRFKFARRTLVWYWKIAAILTMTGGTMFLMWLGEQIDEFGIEPAGPAPLRPQQGGERGPGGHQRGDVDPDQQGHQPSGVVGGHRLEGDVGGQVVDHVGGQGSRAGHPGQVAGAPSRRRRASEDRLQAVPQRDVDGHEQCRHRQRHLPRHVDPPSRVRSRTASTTTRTTAAPVATHAGDSPSANSGPTARHTAPATRNSTGSCGSGGASSTKRPPSSRRCRAHSTTVVPTTAATAGSAASRRYPPWPRPSARSGAGPAGWSGWRREQEAGRVGEPQRGQGERDG